MRRSPLKIARLKWNRSLAALAVALATAFMPGVEAAPQASIPQCPAPFAKLLSDDVFRAHAVRVVHPLAKPALPDVRTGRAHLYRTVIREGAGSGPNFADHYTVIRFGCGAATTCLAIANAENGDVHFPPELESVEALLVDTGETSVDTLNYRRDSRLLVVVGAPDERKERAGISYYVWQSDTLKPTRFIPVAELCK